MPDANPTSNSPISSQTETVKAIPVKAEPVKAVSIRPVAINPGRWRMLIGLPIYLLTTGIVSCGLLLLNSALLFSVYLGTHTSLPSINYVQVWQFFVYIGAAFLLYLEWTLFDSIADAIRRFFRRA